jgi:hypothetical protein
MQESIELARGVIASDGVLTIHLIRYPGRPEFIMLGWPGRIEPPKLPAVTTVTFAVFAEARIQLAAIRAAER